MTKKYYVRIESSDSSPRILSTLNKFTISRKCGYSAAEITPEEYTFLKLKYETRIFQETDEFYLIDTDLNFDTEVEHLVELRGP